MKTLQRIAWASKDYLQLALIITVLLYLTNRIQDQIGLFVGIYTFFMCIFFTRKKHSNFENIFLNNLWIATQAFLAAGLVILVGLFIIDL